MNCKNCNNPLEPHAQFCARCGTTVKSNAAGGGTDPTIPATPMGARPMEAEATLISSQQPLVINPQTLSQQPQQTQWSPADNYMQSREPTTYSPLQDRTEALPTPQPPFAQSAPPLQQPAQFQQSARRARPGFGGCLLRLGAVLVLLAAILIGSWFLFLQPYVHGLVISKIDDKMTKVVDQIPPLNQAPTFPFLPARPPALTIPLSESLLQNFMRLNVAPSDPIQDPVVHITEQGVRLEFNARLTVLFMDFNFPSAVSVRPEINEQGTLVARNVNIEGIATLVLSPDDLTNLLNKHFANAMTKLNNPISRIDLKQAEIDIALK